MNLKDDFGLSDYYDELFALQERFNNLMSFALDHAGEHHPSRWQRFRRWVKKIFS